MIVILLILWSIIGAIWWFNRSGTLPTTPGTLLAAGPLVWLICCVTDDYP